MVDELATSADPPQGSDLESDPKSDPEKLAGGAGEAFAEAVYQVAVGRRQIVEVTVDRLDDDSPLRHPGDGTERIETGLHLVRNPNTELRVILNFFAIARAGWWSAGATF